MRIGLNGGGPSLGRTIADAQRAESEGFAAYSIAGDSTSTLALIGSQTESIELLTAVVPIFGIHPAVIAGRRVWRTRPRAVVSRSVSGCRTR